MTKFKPTPLGKLSPIIHNILHTQKLKFELHHQTCLELQLPTTGCYSGKSLEVLWEVLPMVLRDIGVLRGGVLQSVLRDIGGAPGSAPENALLVDAPPEETRGWSMQRQFQQSFLRNDSLQDVRGGLSNAYKTFQRNFKGQQA